MSWEIKEKSFIEKLTEKMGMSRSAWKVSTEVAMLRAVEGVVNQTWPWKAMENRSEVKKPGGKPDVSLLSLFVEGG